ncbi:MULTISPECIES: TonB-dependent receptor [unclassified Brevundimonas]|uniref:TonB-dependent receptor n=1 Tax=unclassified Brevundimonas TaxID=2622653 RepID=UPI000CFB9AB8|nr:MULTISPECIES: TonB-dependent receptor [unclassified Brevundimonas]PRA29181.1 TonB-dependent receptor [Brevundimonas sp. MYb27]PQZ84859.1 TonB-dependent receptor [Brevundimonas sp. MYb31]PRB14621.1 TonB-dependent receptor [Brevundimonas sp. MYb52]PRB36674.1 TonB-dependent receptor [Brevundimonas sp. MYb46]PRB55695.1 TonB-dependent receptor [Brevundimonas sp. MYb33]
MSTKTNLMAATAMGVLSALALPAVVMAQDAPQNDTGAQDATTVDEIVVTGIRASQQQSINIKRNAVGVVDSIASEDLGKLPDQNVAESLQRIPGVTIDRNRGEGRFVTVRGFGPKFNAVTVNGRTLATDNNGREFSFDVLPSEIISGADVYKSPQANINGASIGATINVRTLRPLDQRKPFAVAGSLGSTWAELADNYSQDASAVASWRNDDRTLGFALAASYVDQDTRNDEFTIGAGHVRRSSPPVGETCDTKKGHDCYFAGRMGPDVAPFSGVSMPSNLSPFFFERSKQMLGLNASGQYRPMQNLTLTLDAMYVKADITERQTGLAYDFSGGTLVEQVVEGGEAVYQRYAGGFVDQIMQYDTRNVETHQLGFNADWQVNDDLKLSFDVSTSTSERKSDQAPSFTTIRRKGVDLWWDRRGGSPIYEYGFNYPGSTADAATDPNGLTAHYYIWNSAGRTKDTIDEYRIDGEWTPGGNVTLYGGIGYQNRIKDIYGTSMPFGQQCAYCGSNEALPSDLFTPTGMNFFDGRGGDIMHDWLTYDPNALMAYVKGLADRDGKAFAPSVYDASASSVVDEKVWTGYLMSQIEADLGGMPLTVNMGVRVENTSYTSSGASKTVISAKPNGSGQNIIVLSDVSPVSFDGDYTDVLPSLNARLSVTDDVIVRFAASRVMTRPTLSDLSPRQSIQTNPGNESIKRGNPDLKPFRATQMEAGVEWYFAPTSLLSFAAFYKNLDSFVSTTTTKEQIDEVSFSVTVPSNGEGATIKGIELGYRQTFDNLPAPFDGLGVQTSFTYADSDAEYSNAGGISYGLEGLSKYSYSLVGFYEKGPIQARLAYTWRDKFVAVAVGRNSEPEYFDAYGQLDAGASYDVTENVTVFLDALNLTDEEEFLYSVSEDRTKEFRTTGRRVSAGVRLRF